MKDIIVGIDFSKNSIHALEYAIDVANAIEANIFMIHVDKPYSSESLFSRKGSEHSEKVVNVFEKLIKKYKPLVKGNLSYKIRKGKIQQADQAG